jgi:predicted nucleic acid-binding protein
LIVVDASVVVEVLLGTAAGRAVEGRLFARRAALHAPHLMDIEVAHVLRRYAAAGEMTPARAAEAVEDLKDLPITRHEHTMFLPRIWQLRHNATAYDAAYLALAEALDATLVTRDAKLARAAGRTRVEWLK